MTWDEVLDLVIESTAGDWRVVAGTHGFDLDIGAKASEPYSALAIYRPDVSIALCWGAGDGEAFPEDWVRTFQRGKTVREWLDIRVHGVPIFRTAVIVVDGGRCYLPMPTILGEARRVPHRYMALVRLLESIRPKGQRTAADMNFEDYVREAGLVETSDDWPDEPGSI